LIFNIGGVVKLIGGNGDGAPAAILNGGDMIINVGGKFDYTYTGTNGAVDATHTTSDVGILLQGGLGSGVYDRDNQPILIYFDVSSQVQLLFPAINGGAGGGQYYLQPDSNIASAFIQSSSKRGFNDSLLGYIIFAANEETRTGRIRTGVSNADDSSKPSCN